MWPSGTDPRTGATHPIDAGRRRRTHLDRRPVLLAAAITAIVLAACASAASPAAQAPNGDDFGRLQGNASAAPAASPAGGPLDGSNGSGTGTGKGGSPQDPLPDVNLIVRTGSMTVEVPSIDPALLRARTAIAGLGGYISASDQANDDDRTIASVTYRFPSGRWEDAQTAIRELATKVVSAKTGSSEVTSQVVDLAARISNLRSTEAALQAIMAKATKIPDILEVQNQLTAVQGQIEQLSAQEANLRDQASLATLTVLFQTPAVAVVNTVSSGWNPGADLDHAAGQLLGVLQALGSSGIWLAVVGVPLFGGTLLVLFVILFVGRRLARRLAPWFGRYAASPEATGPGA
jgi:hypothetical protein